ncbi:MAG: hypothetical protein ACR2J1_03830 [Methyloceanibacter sp.]|uniref:hypothetical protein n=1 Tax=Methyloceanibacter sp. TaxID=1965321 RepID=UPI003D9BB1A3
MTRREGAAGALPFGMSLRSSQYCVSASPVKISVSRQVKALAVSVTPEREEQEHAGEEHERPDAGIGQIGEAERLMAAASEPFSRSEALAGIEAAAAMSANLLSKVSAGQSSAAATTAPLAIAA